MKKLILVVLFTTSLLAKSQVKEGIIRKVTCNAASGLGHIKLEYKTSKKELTTESLKVNSYELCGSDYNQYSKLGSIGYDGIFGLRTAWYKVYMENDFVIDIEEVEEIKYHKYVKKVRTFKTLNHVKTFRWFNSGPVNIFHVRQEDIDSSVEKYTSDEYLQNFI